MSASAGVAAVAAYERLAAAVRGETARAQAAIVIVSRDPGTREILHRELSKRYAADYQIAACGRAVSPLRGSCELGPPPWVRRAIASLSRGCYAACCGCIFLCLRCSFVATDCGDGRR